MTPPPGVLGGGTTVGVVVETATVGRGRVTPVVARPIGVDDADRGGVEARGGAAQKKHGSSPGGTTSYGIAMPAIISARPPTPAVHDMMVERLVRSDIRVILTCAGDSTVEYTKIN
ncbi:hypothetical protein [Kutzneria buriramensis]|uniref:hypothetical protein n=1 Tax=Kutzneria buriramensis TaxID=1045776 RepID=UPI000E2398B8|nr:hypothetical protein [Kutzneria buriramensis]